VLYWKKRADETCGLERRQYEEQERGQWGRTLRALSQLPSRSSRIRVRLLPGSS
jgi:hypothetical protein